MPLFLSLMIFLWCVPRSYWRGPSWQEVFIEKAVRYNVTTRTPWPIEGKRIQEKTRCRTAAAPKETLKKIKKDAKGNVPQTAAQTSNEKLKDPNLSSACAEELWVKIGIFEFFVGHLCSSLWRVCFFHLFLIAFVLQLFSIGNFKGFRAITTFVAIFPSSFQWQEHKHGCSIWSSHLGFKFNTVSCIFELRYALLYLPVFRYAYCSLVYFKLQLIWWSCSCLFSSCHILCKLACTGSEINFLIRAPTGDQV